VTDAVGEPAQASAAPGGTGWATPWSGSSRWSSRGRVTRSRSPRSRGRGC